MSSPPHKKTGIKERQYAHGMLNKVVALATRLQTEQESTLTEGQIHAIGKEIGLEPALIEQALNQLEMEQTRTPADSYRKVEFWSMIAAFVVPLVWGLLAFLTRDKPGIQTFFAYLSPVPLAVLLGFISGKKDAGVLAAMMLAIVLAIALGFPLMLPYLGIGLPLARWLGRKGAEIREQHAPVRPSQERVSRQDLLHVLFSLDSRIKEQKRHRAFLSVDVVGSSELSRSGTELTVEYTFGQFRRWVEDVVKSYGGEVQSAAGDGVMCLFTDNAAAVRAARQIQQDLPQFNAEQNRLPLPFQLRCGVSAGEVLIEEGMLLRDLQSPVIYRAAAMQKCAEPGDIVVSEEVAPAAALELSQLAPLPAAAEGQAAYSWRAGQRARDTGTTSA